MKTFTRVYKWIVLSVFLQVVILSYINFIYLSADGKITATIAEISESARENTSMKIPEGTSDVKVSFDGTYVGYIEDKKLVIVDLNTKKVKKVLNADRNNLTYYRWLPDSHMVIYSISAADGQPGQVQMFTYEIEGEVERNYPKIGNLPKGSQVEDIELSPQTNVVYAKVVTGSNQAQVYKFNIMNTLTYILTATKDIHIKELSFSDKLFYQDSKNRIFVRDGIKNTNTQLQFKEPMALLEIDSEDRVYVGELDENNRVVKIYYGKYTAAQEEKKWTEIALEKPVESTDLKITSTGSLFEIVKEEKTIYEIGSKDKISYKGEVIEILDDYLVTMDNNRIELTVIESKSQQLKQ